MHEASLMAEILDAAAEQAQAHGSPAVLAIKLRVGALAGVVREALEFAFDALKAGTVCERAALEVETVPLRAHCPSCARDIEGDGDLCLLCPRCGRAAAILAGRELEIEYLELEDACNA